MTEPKIRYLSNLLNFTIALTALLTAGHVSAASGLPPQRFEVEVIDGDTLRISGSKQSIRLYGVDACESGQPMTSKDGQRFDCGSPAVSALKQWTERQTVSCEIRDYDRYNRALAFCGTQAVPDFSAELIRQGLAVAYRYRSRAVWPEYQRIEDSAKRQNRGIWAYSFDEPWIYRKNLKN